MFSERNISWYLCEYDGNLKLFEKFIREESNKEDFWRFPTSFRRIWGVARMDNFMIYLVSIYIEVNVVRYAHYARC